MIEPAFSLNPEDNDHRANKKRLSHFQNVLTFSALL